jgi:hypothetical protein
MGNQGRELLELASGPERIGEFESGSSCRNADQYHGDAVQSAARSSIGTQEPGRQRSGGVHDVVSRPSSDGVPDRVGSHRAGAPVLLRLSQLQVWRPPYSSACRRDYRANRARHTWRINDSFRCADCMQIELEFQLDEPGNGPLGASSASRIRIFISHSICRP